MISMISATFGDECWSARGAGLGMIMQAIKVGASRIDACCTVCVWRMLMLPWRFHWLLVQVRQGQSVKIVLEGNNESADKKSRAAQTAAQAKAAQDAAKKVRRYWPLVVNAIPLPVEVRLMPVAACLCEQKEADLLREIEEEDKGKKKFFGLF